ncbi:MAG: GNAT family N-acetyltransferase [Crocinitomicaceae bacterium]|nr:GNAT family N-acetyltransferase [Crocinitomicaceae bacterium]|tara:strand:- start:1649 stop:2143 length:495 start_codon:yes stop_codon:yes gene_type:complete
MDESSSAFTIRSGTQEDVASVHKLIVELAIYERAENEVTTTIQQLKEDGFGVDPIYRLFVAESQGEIVGMALWYEKYSTWKGRCGFLEDLVVRQTHRGKGIGKALFLAVAEACAVADYGRMEWQVLDWNELAIGFYDSLGAELDSEWLNGKLTREGLRGLATSR